MYEHTYILPPVKMQKPPHPHTSMHPPVPPTHSCTSMTTDWKSFSGSADTKGNSSDKDPDTAQQTYVHTYRVYGRAMSQDGCTVGSVVKGSHLCWAAQGTQHVSLPSSSLSILSCSTLCHQRRSLVSSHLCVQTTLSLSQPLTSTEVCP